MLCHLPLSTLFQLNDQAEIVESVTEWTEVCSHANIPGIVSDQGCVIIEHSVTIFSRSADFDNLAISA